MQTTKVFLVLSPLVINGIVWHWTLLYQMVLYAIITRQVSPLGWHCRCQGRSHCQGRERGRRGLGDETKKAIMTWHHSHLSVDIGTRNREPSFLVHATRSLVNFYQQAQTHSIVKVVFIIHWDSDTFSLNSIWGCLNMQFTRFFLPFAVLGFHRWSGCVTVYIKVVSTVFNDGDGHWYWITKC